MNKKELTKWKEKASISFFISFLYLFLVVLTIYSALAYDSEEVVTINDSNLPSSGTLIFALNGQPNGTAFIKQIEFNEHINLTFPQNVSFGAYNTTNLLVDYNVYYFIPSENITLNTSLNITNDFNSNLQTQGILFDIIKKPLINLNSTEKFNILNDGYNITISQGLLPKSGNLDFNLQGKVGSTTIISNCGDWLICPTNVFMDSEEKIISIPYTIPFNISLGVYDNSFVAHNDKSNITKIGRIKFTIIPEQINIQSFRFRDDCFDEFGIITQECINEYAEYLKRTREEQYNLRYLKENLTKEVPVEKLVMVGSVNEELKKLYDSCNSELTGAKENLNSCQYNNGKLIEEKSKYDEMMTLQERQNEEEKKDMNETVMQQLEKQKKNIKWLFGILAGIILISIYGIKHYQVQKTWNHKNRVYT